MSAPSLDLDVSARLSAALDGLTAQVRDDRRERMELANGVAYIPDIIVSAAALPFAQVENFGPKTGYAWAVQSVRVNDLGASTDYVQVYRGKSTQDAAPPRPALFTFTPGSSAPYFCAPWHPGRTGLVLTGGAGLVLNGSVTGIGAGQPLLVAIDVVQLTLAKLPYFLL